MNQYIVSQWFKYKKDLETFYKRQINALKEDSDGCLLIYDSFCKVGSHPRIAEADPDWPDTVVMLCDKVIVHLLDHVVNRGTRPLKLKLIDNECHNVEFTGCYDVEYSLRDGRGHPWIISAFFGTGDSWLHLAGMTRQKLLTLMMHLSLLMVQRLRKVSECVYSSRIVYGTNACTCTIHFLVDIKGLSTIRKAPRWDLYCTLLDLPRETLNPLFLLMTGKQRREMFTCLEVLKKYEDDLAANPDNNNRPMWLEDLRMNQRADVLLDKLVKFNLTGYFAICSSEPRGTGELHYHKDVSYKKMEEYDSRFTGDSYFLAVGKTLNDLMENIEYTALEHAC